MHRHLSRIGVILQRKRRARKGTTIATAQTGMGGDEGRIREGEGQFEEVGPIRGQARREGGEGFSLKAKKGEDDKLKLLRSIFLLFHILSWRFIGANEFSATSI